jgi:outer membrane protein assembly factor BamB
MGYRRFGWLVSLAWLGALGACKSAGGSESPAVDAGQEAGTIGPASVLEEHVHPTEDGAYIQPTLTTSAAANLHVDPTFQGAFNGTSYGELLYVDSLRPGVDAVFVASDANHVTALNAATGDVLWDTTLGPTVPESAYPCSERPIPLFGISSSPIIDATTRTLYVASFQPSKNSSGSDTLVYALSIDDGSTRSGWPADIAASVKGFDGTTQRVRAGLGLLNGTLYVPVTSIYDCSDYHGWVIGIETANPEHVTSWSTPASGGGIWGGIVSDGTSIFVTTGNTARGTSTWGGGEAAIRLSADLAFSGKSPDYFVPSNWEEMDTQDLDLGSGSPIMFDLPGAQPSTLLAAMGKEGVLFLLDRDNLGGLGTGNGTTGEGLFSQKLVVGLGLQGHGATYETTKGRYLVYRGTGQATSCPAGMAGDMIAVRVEAASPPTFSVAWCAVSNGAGSPVVTTTNGTADPIVWITSTDRLYGFDGDTGAVVYSGGGSGDQMNTLWRWLSPVIAKGRLFVAGQGKVYAFAPTD